MNDQMQRKELWEEVERTAALWTASIGVSYPVIPVEHLRPLWNSVASGAVSQRDRLRYEAAVTEALLLKNQNALLRNEVQSLREQLAKVTDLGIELPAKDISNKAKAS